MMVLAEAECQYGVWMWQTDIGVHVKNSWKEKFMGEAMRCKIQQVRRNQLMKNSWFQFEKIQILSSWG